MGGFSIAMLNYQRVPVIHSYDFLGEWTSTLFFGAGFFDSNLRAFSPWPNRLYTGVFPGSLHLDPVTFCIALPGIGGAIQADSLNAAASACSKGYHWQQALLFGEDRAVGMWFSIWKRWHAFWHLLDSFGIFETSKQSGRACCNFMENSSLIDLLPIYIYIEIIVFLE